MEATRLVEDNGAQGTSILHGQLQSRVSLFFANIMMDDAVTEGSALVWIKAMLSKFVSGHATDGMDEVMMVKVFKAILIGIMGVGTVVELMSGRAFDPVLVMSILGKCQGHV